MMLFRCRKYGSAIQGLSILTANIERLLEMSLRTHHAVKRRKNKSGLWLVLGLLLCFGLFLGYRQIAAHDQNWQSLNQRNDISSADAVSKGYKLLTMDSTALSKGDLVLVDKAHPYSFPDNQELVSIYEHKEDCYYVRNMNVLLDKNVLDHLNDMLAVFCEKTGLQDINVVAGYRTYEFQQKLYNESLADNGEEHTAAYIALSGCSEHHTGLAVDFSIFHIEDGTSEAFDGSGDYTWFNDNAWVYGFVLRYIESKTAITGVADEPWHFRYVGVPHAYYMTQNNLCLEEYTDLLRQYPYDGVHLNIDCAGQKYEVYYCQGLQVRVPDKGVYTVSGNNDTGFIVTVTRR